MKETFGGGEDSFNILHTPSVRVNSIGTQTLEAGRDEGGKEKWVYAVSGGRSETIRTKS